MTKFKGVLETAAFAFANAYGHLWATAVVALTDAGSAHYNPDFVLDFDNPESVRRVDDLADEFVGPVGGQYLAPELVEGAGGMVFSHTTQTGRTSVQLWTHKGELCCSLEISRPDGVVIRIVNTDDDGVARATFSPNCLPRHIEAARQAIAPLAAFIPLAGVEAELQQESPAALRRQVHLAQFGEKEFVYLISALKGGSHPLYLAAALEEYRLLQEKLNRFLADEWRRALDLAYNYANPGQSTSIKAEVEA